MCNGSEEHTKYQGTEPQTREAYHKVRYIGVPIIVLGSRLSRPTEAKSGAQVGDTAFVLGVLTTNHVRNKIDLEVKLVGGGV